MEMTDDEMSRNPKIVGWYANYSSEEDLLQALKERSGPYKLLDLLRKSCKILGKNLRILCRPEYKELILSKLSTKTTRCFIDRISMREIPKNFLDDEYLDEELIFVTQVEWNKLFDGELQILDKVIYFKKIWDEACKLKENEPPNHIIMRSDIVEYGCYPPSLIRLYDEELARQVKAFHGRKRRYLNRVSK